MDEHSSDDANSHESHCDRADVSSDEGGTFDAVPQAMHIDTPQVENEFATYSVSLRKTWCNV